MPPSLHGLVTLHAERPANETEGSSEEAARKHTVTFANTGDAQRPLAVTRNPPPVQLTDSALVGQNWKYGLRERQCSTGPFFRLKTSFCARSSAAAGPDRLDHSSAENRRAKFCLRNALVT